MRRPALLLALLSAALMSTPAAHAEAEGQFVVGAPRVETRAMRQEAREMQDTGTLQELARSLNSIFILPQDITLRFVECGEANAYYSSDDHEISMCLELMASMAETLEGQFTDDDQTANALAGAFIAVALHEVGHALVDVLEIPVTGREEDAVDQLSAWMLIQADDADSVRGAAATYYTDDEVGDDDFADEHSLNKQRYFNLICWAYGSDPENQQDLIDTWELPENRAERCSGEYAQLDRSWTKLLLDHLRDSEEIAGGDAADAAESDDSDDSVFDGVVGKGG